MSRSHNTLIARLDYIISRLILDQDPTRSEAWVKARNMQLAGIYSATEKILASPVVSLGSAEQEHVLRVASTCELIAESLGLDQDQTCRVSIAALVHEVELTSDHAAAAACIPEEMDDSWSVTEMVFHHRENFDGSGSPDGLRRELIPLGSRIIRIAETYDALVFPRYGRDPASHQEAMKQLQTLSGSRLDPAVVEAFICAEAQVMTLTGWGPAESVWEQGSMAA